MDIKALSQHGESNTLEYKRNTDPLASILRSVVSFANTAGGIILIGIEDDGQICGVNNADKMQEQLANAITNGIKPELLPEITLVSIKSKSVIVIEVEHSPGPYYLSEKGKVKGVYIRLGNTNLLAGTEVVSELKRQHNYFSFDQAPCSNVTESDLDSSKIDAVYAKGDRVIDTAKLMSIGVLTKKGSRTLATNGGVILFGKNEVHNTYFPYAEVQCARFAGNAKTEFIDRLNLEEGVLSALKEVPKFIRRNTKMAGKFGAMQRRDIPEYPVEAIREALTNAIAHANYEVSGSRISVAIYDDQLTIQNPGIMPPGMSIDQFKAGVSRIRNPVIARALKELGLVEEWGSGYKRIKSACEEGGYPLPTWEEFGTALRVTFYPHPEVVELSEEPSAEDGTRLALGWHQAGTKLGLKVESLQLLDFCRESRFLQEMQDVLGSKDKTKFRRRTVAPLLNKNLLAMTIPDKPSSPNQCYITTEEGIKLLGEINKNK